MGPVSRNRNLHTQRSHFNPLRYGTTLLTIRFPEKPPISYCRPDQAGLPTFCLDSSIKWKPSTSSKRRLFRVTTPACNQYAQNALQGLFAIEKEIPCLIHTRPETATPGQNARLADQWLRPIASTCILSTLVAQERQSGGYTRWTPGACTDRSAHYDLGKSRTGRTLRIRTKGAVGK